jgi:hypothetical protein
LFHEVLSFVDFAHLELFQEGVLEKPVLDEAGEGEVRLETFEDEGLVGGGFFLIDDCEVFVDLAVVALHFDGAEFSSFSSSLLLQQFFLIGLES